LSPRLRGVNAAALADRIAAAQVVLVRQYQERFGRRLHSCGRVNEVVEGLIEAGADAVNLQQPRALGIEEMGRRYRGRIAFESLADIQATLPSGDPARIREDARQLGRHWMSRAGGFVLSDYGDGRAIGAADAAKRVMYAAFSEVSAEVYGRPLPPPRPT
jgi:hypothetical protein